MGLARVLSAVSGMWNANQGWNLAAAVDLGVAGVLLWQAMRFPTPQILETIE